MKRLLVRFDILLNVFRQRPRWTVGALVTVLVVVFGFYLLRPKRPAVQKQPHSAAQTASPTQINPTTKEITNGSFAFFVNGKPAVGFVQDRDGTISLFSTPQGHHWINNEAIKPVTPEVVRKYAEQQWTREGAQREQDELRAEAGRQTELAKKVAEAAEEARQEQVRLRLERENAEKAKAAAEKQVEEEQVRYLARYLAVDGTKRPTAPVPVAVTVVSETGVINGNLGNAIADWIKSEDVGAISSPFTQAFVTDGLFAQAFDGSRSALDRLQVTNLLNSLALGRQAVNFATNAALDGLITAYMKLDLSTLHFASATPPQRQALSVSGVGFRAEEARAQAEERLIKQINGGALKNLWKK